MNHKAIVVAIMALVMISLPAMADDITLASAEVDVSLNIEKYCYIEVTDDIDITISEGGTSGSDDAGYNTGANFDGTLGATLAMAEGTPGTWSWNLGEGVSQVVDVNNEEISSSLTVSVTDVDYADGNGGYAGTLTLTLWQDE